MGPRCSVTSRAASGQDKHMNHYNHCLPHTGYTPNHKHITIIDSGCTGHYLKVAAPVTNKKIAKTPIQVTLLDGATIQSSHTCDLLLPQLPDTAKKVHIIPGLATISPLSVGQLVDTECSVTFDRTKVKVLHNHEKKLMGQRDARNGLWTVDFQDNNPRPPLDGKK
jgi:hypothetical protein